MMSTQVQDFVNHACAASLDAQVKVHALHASLMHLERYASKHNQVPTRLLEMSRVLKRTLVEIDRELAEGFHNDD